MFFIRNLLPLVVSSLIKRLLFVTAIATVCFYTSCKKEKGDLDTPDAFCDTLNVKYNDTIKKIITTTCATTVSCHIDMGSGPGNFSSYSDLKAAVDDGSFSHWVFNSPASPMPPTYVSKQLSDCEKQQLRRWINMGAPNN